MKSLLPILYWLWPSLTIAQAKGVSFSVKTDTVKPKAAVYKPEILTSGFIDIVNNGQVNASARFIRLMIGEPGKLAVPLSLYSGVSSNNFQNQQSPGGLRSNEHLVSSFINPLSGLANMSVDGVLFLSGNKEKITRGGFIYHGGLRILTGYKAGPVTDAATGRPVNFLNSFGSGGLYFQTGAWERNNLSADRQAPKNLGVFWLAVRYIFCKSGYKQLQEIVPAIRTNGLYHGWSAAWGVEINNLVNIRVVYYKYIKKPEIDYTLPIYQFSFNYSLKN